MDKILKWVKKYPKIVIALVIIGIPIIVYLLSIVPLLPAGKNNDWAGFWGGYVGAIIGGGCTVIGVYWTIIYTQENFKEDVRNRSLPYLALTTLECDRSTNLFHLMEENNNLESNEADYYREHRLDGVYIIIENGEIKYRKRLSDDNKLLLKNGGLEKQLKDKKGCVSICDRGMISMPIEFENVGNGAALSFRLGLNHEDSKDPTYILPLNLKVGDKFYTHIFSTDNIESDVNHGRYILGIVYNDIYQNEYFQKYKFILGKNEETNKVVCSLELDGEQERM